MARVTANRAPNLSIALQRPQFCATAPRCADLSAKRQYSTSSPKERVAVIGSGNWGTTVSKIIGENVAKNPSIFEEEVRVWVHEETVGGRKLSEVINETKTNPKYLPGIPLPRNLTADPNLASAVRGATALVFVLPHEFLASTCLAIRETLNNEPTKGKVKAVSLIKGLVTSDRFELPSQYISRTLSRDPQHLVPVSVLSGANISSEIAKEQFTESTLGYSTLSSPFNPLWTRLFTTPYFRVQAVNDIAGVELCGALKNIVALAAGFAAGLGAGSNTRATVIRLGMVEMKRFADAYFGGMDNATLLESCGVADMITSCTSGRNFTLARTFASRPSSTLAQLEIELLAGQKLQGTGTAAEVYAFLERSGDLDKFPLFRTVHRIASGEWEAGRLLEEIAAV